MWDRLGFAGLGSGLNCVALGVCALFLGCSGSSSTDGSSGLSDVSGAWCGANVATAVECVGDEVGYLELTQSGETVSGQSCEAFEHDCQAVQAGTFSGNHLSYFYTFDVYRVDASFDVASATTLHGTFHSDKCNCDQPLTLHRVK